MELLKQLCAIHSPSGEEYRVRDFLIEYINRHKGEWKTQPELFYGKGFQDCLVLIFGKPETAIFSHLDTVGFTVQYDKKLIKIGQPNDTNGIKLTNGKKTIPDSCTLLRNEDGLTYHGETVYPRGTSLTFEPFFDETDRFVTSNSLDNRLGVWCALQIAETLENGAVVFSCCEEHKGGTVGFLTRLLYEKYQIMQSLILDTTWITNGIHFGGGAVISVRDSRIPRQQFVNQIITIAEKNKQRFQLEVEAYGGSDGSQIQDSPYPMDWCFIGVPQEHVHAPWEKVFKPDIFATIDVYKTLMKHL